jgi:orotate phosphoribosyltransferase
VNLIPTQEEVLDLLRSTGALRSGYFAYPDGYFSEQHLQLPLILRNYDHANTLAVALSRLVRQNSELRAVLPQLSLVSPSPNGLPIAYAMCETLKAKQVYWAEAAIDGNESGLRFPQYVEPQKGEKVLMVDDIYRSGRKLTQLRRLLESFGAQVLGVTVLIKHPFPQVHALEGLPVYSLASLPPVSSHPLHPGKPEEPVRV